MSRRPASVTQADVARALRAAQQAGPAWRVELDGGVIRMIQGNPASPAATPAPETPQPPLLAEPPKWRL